jgi:hypothetical protein
MCGGCDYEVYSTQAGEHVVYHWDASAQAAEDMPLCGGTVKAADRLVAGIADYYGWTLGADGPSIEYFWDRALAKSVCNGHGVVNCTKALLGPADVFTEEAFHSHELAHTAKGGPDTPRSSMKPSRCVGSLAWSPGLLLSKQHQPSSVKTSCELNSS